MTSAPRLTPSSLNWTTTTPMLSVAFAATVRVPEIVAPAVGVMMEAAGGVMSVNVAVTVVAALRVTVQAPGPEQPPPLQPLKVEPAAGAAVSVTAVPPGQLPPQGAPPGMPAGGLLPRPAPRAPLLNGRGEGVGGGGGGGGVAGGGGGGG